MALTTFTFPSDDGLAVHTFRWAGKDPKAVVQIAHGMGEHAARYGRLAERLVDAGYAVYANDHRGHGRTAPDAASLGVFAEKDGWNRLVDDVHRLNRRIAEEHPGAPRILLGHSMGSAAAQHYMVEHGDTVHAVCLSGSTAFDGMAAMLDVVRQEAERLGPAGKSELLDGLTFGAFNQAFEPPRTAYDWLSRDPDEVDRYVDDPLCGFTVSAQGMLDMLEAAVAFSSPESLARIPKRLPVYLLAGDRDPVHANLTGLETLLERYRAAGLGDLTWKFYPEGRHEMFNETNRDEVTADLIEWLDSVTPAR